MGKEINFVVPFQTDYLNLYQNVIFTMIKSIIQLLPRFTISHATDPNAVNIYFFNEASYLRKKMAEGNICVFLPHGMGDKNLRDGWRVQGFDYICVSGPAWREKLLTQGIPNEKILVVGYPKLDSIFQHRAQQSHRNREKIKILYAPTHEGSAPCTSYPAFLPYLDQFPGDMGLIPALHPYYDSSRNIVMEEIGCVDVVISDGSSVIFEALSLGVPVVFPDWLVKDAILDHWSESFTSEIFREGIGYHADTFQQLIQCVYAAAQTGLTEQDRLFAEKIFPAELRGTSGKAAAEAFILISEERA